VADVWNIVHVVYGGRYVKSAALFLFSHHSLPPVSLLWPIELSFVKLSRV
jgi:hypothetical protein